MNTSKLVEKFKLKVNETNEIVESTSAKQIKLLSSAKELNFKLRNFIEGDINEKNTFADSQEKLGMVKTRIENCKQTVHSIRDKIKNLKLKYQI
jgi:hypothetical protein